MEKEEQAKLEASLKDRNNLPLNIFGQNPERITATRRRYELLFGLLLNSGLRISEALGLKVSDVRLVDGTAKSVRVIGKGDKERRVPLPEAFGQVIRLLAQGSAARGVCVCESGGLAAGVRPGGAGLLAEHGAPGRDR